MALIVGTGLIAALAFVAAIALLFAPPRRVVPSAATNWEQRNDLLGAENSPGVVDSVSPVDVAVAVQFDSGGAH